MAKASSLPPITKRTSSSQHKASAVQPPSVSPASQPVGKNGPKRYEAPADFQESEAPLRMQTDATAVAQELWLFQLPHELDPTEHLNWQLKSTPDGVVSGTCKDSDGVSYTLTEEPSDMATQLYTTPAAGSSSLSQFKRRVTVVRANQLPDAIAAAEALEAVMPAADMPGIPSTTQPHAEEPPVPVQKVSNAAVQQQQQQQDHQAGVDLMATPDDTKQQRKKAKSEAKKLKKRAQEATAINEKQSKLQRQSDTPVLAPEALQVSEAPEIKSEAAQLQDNVNANLSIEGNKLKTKKSSKDKKSKKHRDKDGGKTPRS